MVCCCVCCLSALSEGLMFSFKVKEPKGFLTNCDRQSFTNDDTELSVSTNWFNKVCHHRDEENLDKTINRFYIMET